MPRKFLVWLRLERRSRRIQLGSPLACNGLIGLFRGFVSELTNPARYNGDKGASNSVEDGVFSVVSKTLFRVVVIAAVVCLGLLAWSVIERSTPPTAPDANIADQARRPLNHVVHHGDLLGVLQVPRLGLTVPVVEGADADSLLHGAGHVIHTAFPGHYGNAGIAAHRDTCFRPLRFIRPGDHVMITSPDGVYDYVVAGTEIVLPSDGEVLHRSRNRDLTLVTCYPFYYLGHAPKRFIVHATEPDSSVPATLVAGLR